MLLAVFLRTEWERIHHECKYEVNRGGREKL
jgi:hypothetical protein